MNEYESIKKTSSKNCWHSQNEGYRGEPVIRWFN